MARSAIFAALFLLCFVVAEVISGRWRLASKTLPELLKAQRQGDLELNRIGWGLTVLAWFFLTCALISFFKR